MLNSLYVKEGTKLNLSILILSYINIIDLFNAALMTPLRSSAD
jgi:hypothetical protein